MIFILTIAEAYIIKDYRAIIQLQARIPWSSFTSISSSRISTILTIEALEITSMTKAMESS